jgi:hypothetical protein
MLSSLNFVAPNFVDPDFCRMIPWRRGIGEALRLGRLSPSAGTARSNFNHLKSAYLRRSVAHESRLTRYRASHSFRGGPHPPTGVQLFWKE